MRYKKVPMRILTVLLPLILLTDVAFSELICERPDGCRWIGSTCQDCIEKPPIPKPERKVPSTINHFHIYPKVIQHEYVITRPPTIHFSNPSIILSGLSRDSSGWRFRARVGAYECLMPPLRSGDKRGVFSCGGTLSSFSVFF